MQQKLKKKMSKDNLDNSWLDFDDDTELLEELGEKKEYFEEEEKNSLEEEEEEEEGEEEEGEEEEPKEEPILSNEETYKLLAGLSVYKAVMSIYF